MDVEIKTDFDFNPICKKVAMMFPFVQDAGYLEGSEPLNDREQQGYIGERQYLFKPSNSDQSKHEIKLSVSIYIRDINCFGISVYDFLDYLSSYCLYKKAIRELGLGRRRG